jgi:hypothetical protein
MTLGDCNEMLSYTRVFLTHERLGGIKDKINQTHDLKGHQSTYHLIRRSQFHNHKGREHLGFGHTNPESLAKQFTTYNAWRYFIYKKQKNTPAQQRSQQKEKYSFADQISISNQKIIPKESAQKPHHIYHLS